MPASSLILATPADQRTHGRAFAAGVRVPFAYSAVTPQPAGRANGAVKMDPPVQHSRSVEVKLRITIALSVAGAVLAGSALADEKLAQSKGCLACHQIDTKVVGPAYADVAAKYKDDAGAEARLIKKVMEGGTGVWGQIPMPPNKISEADAKTLVDWILAMKK
jgi:cytochrome c